MFDGKFIPFGIQRQKGISMDLQKSLIEIAKRISPDYVSARETGKSFQIWFSEETKTTIQKIIDAFNSGRFGTENANAEDIYKNALFRNDNMYNLDPLGYELVLLYFISEKAKNLKLTEFSHDFVTFCFTDKETSIVTYHTFYNSPSSSFLILQREGVSKPYFCTTFYKNQVYLTYVYSEER